MAGTLRQIQYTPSAKSQNETDNEPAQRNMERPENRMVKDCHSVTGEGAGALIEAAVDLLTEFLCAFADGLFSGFFDGQ